MHISGRKISFKYPDQIELLFENISFSINKDSKIGLVGDNGCGKSTLFSLILGENEPTSGSISFEKTSFLGYLPQELKINEDLTVSEYLWQAKPELHKIREDLLRLEDSQSIDYCNLITEFQALDGYRFESLFEKLLAGFNLGQKKLSLKVKDLSGGEKTKIAICRIFISEPDIMLLDEPTNHLEIETLAWLENFLGNCKIPYLFISHDRFFLDKCAASLWEISSKGLRTYSGNWSFYKKEKDLEQQRQMHLYKTQQKKIDKLRKTALQRRKWAVSHQPETRPDGYAPIYETVINPAKSAMKRAKTIEKRIQMTIEREEAKKPFIRKEKKISFKDSTLESKLILEVKNLKKTFETLTIFQNVSFSVSNGARLCIIGKNGSGKSTLLKIITGEIDSFSGHFRWAPGVKIGYYAQEHENLNAGLTVLEEVLQGRVLEQTEARIILGCLNIRGEMVEREISTLSSGERSKTALAKIIFSDFNVLVLDEPTNHFELSAREAFERALANYSGSVILVTHDRYLLNLIATEIYDMDKSRSFYGSFSEYQLKLKF